MGVEQLPRNPLAESEMLLARAARVTPGGVHSNVRLTTKPHPIFFQRGEGSHLYDVDGNSYIDFVLGQGVAFLGHAHPAIVAAVTEALGSGQLYAGQHRPELELGELLCELLPSAERIRFTSSGSEAVQAALRIARAATRRRRIVKFEGHYHGWLDNMLVSVSPRRLPADGSREAVAETNGQVVPPMGEVVVLPWNDADVVEAELESGDVAAVIMEPIAANHSVILPANGYLERVRAACERSGTALIFDEIITGFRLGLGGAQQRFGVTPDLTLFGKAMASGFPIAAVAGRASLFEDIATGNVVHAGTFNSNVSSVTAALATVRTLQADPGLYETVDRVGKRLLEGFASVSGGDLVVQGLPPLVWVGFGEGPVRSARDLLRCDEDRTAAISGDLALRGFHVTARGTWYVSAMHTEVEADSAVEAFAKAVMAIPARGDR